MIIVSKISIAELHVEESLFVAVNGLSMVVSKLASLT